MTGQIAGNDEVGGELPRALVLRDIVGVPELPRSVAALVGDFPDDVGQVAESIDDFAEESLLPDEYGIVEVGDVAGGLDVDAVDVVRTAIVVEDQAPYVAGSVVTDHVGAGVPAIEHRELNDDATVARVLDDAAPVVEIVLVELREVEPGTTVDGVSGTGAQIGVDGVAVRLPHGEGGADVIDAAGGERVDHALVQGVVVAIGSEGAERRIIAGDRHGGASDREAVRVGRMDPGDVVGRGGRVKAEGEDGECCDQTEHSGRTPERSRTLLGNWAASDRTPPALRRGVRIRAFGTAGAPQERAATQTSVGVLDAGAVAQDEFAGELRDGRNAAIAHRHDQLRAEDVDDALDTGLSVSGEAPDVRAANADRPGAEGQRLEDLGAAAEASVDQDGEVAADGVDHFGEDVDGAATGLGGASAVVRDDHAVGAVLAGEDGVLRGVDAFEEELHLRQLLEATDVGPVGERWIHVPGEAGEHGFRAIAGGALIRVGAGGVAVRADARIGAAEAHGGFGVTAAEGVDSPGEDGAAGGLDAMDEFLGFGPGDGHVHLVPGRLAEGFGDVLHAGRGDGGEHLDDVLFFGGARGA